MNSRPRILKRFSRILTSGGYPMRTESSGKRAIRALDAAASVHLMALDLGMPEYDGFEILQTLRAERPGLRVLVTSGCLRGALLKASDFLGATAILNKAGAPQLLLPVVNRLLQKQRTKDYVPDGDL